MTTEIEVTAGFEFQADGEGETVRAQLDRIMDELVELCESGSGISDPAMSVDLAAHRLDIELIARAEDFDAAVACADSCIRTAAHAAGWSTPQWNLHKQEQRAELIGA